MRTGKSIAMIALSAMLALGCNDDVSAPADSGPADVLPGTLEVSIIVSGPRPDPDGYDVVVSLEGQGDLFSQVAPRGGTAAFLDLAPGTHSVALESLAENCSVEGENPRSLTTVAGQTSRVGFVVSCPGPSVAGLFQRVSPFSEGTIEFHRSLSSRYMIQENGTFGLEFQSARFGFFEYLGTYSIVGTEILFDFDASSTAGEWRATGTLQGDCLTVEYNVVMLLSDFENGEYCRQDPQDPDALPGALEVSVTVNGTRPDPDGYTVAVSVDGQGDLFSQVAPRGGTAAFLDLAPGTHSVALESLAENCSVLGGSSRRFTVVAGQTSRIEFNLFCPAPGVAGVFQRVSPFSEGTIEFHRSLSSRYVIQENGTFGLEFQSARFGFFEYLGTYSIVGTEILFDFDASNRAGEWQATGTLSGDCLTVEYNVVMYLADFENGEYCRSPGA